MEAVYNTQPKKTNLTFANFRIIPASRQFLSSFIPEDAQSSVRLTVVSGIKNH
jgi:hypothetical protein